MTIQTTSGCEIMKCTHYRDGVCHYSAPWCKHSHEATSDLLGIATDALQEVSNAFYEIGGLTNAKAAADDMREIADSALRRLRLQNPH